MTNEEKFLFDLKGYILFPAVLGEDEMAPIKEQCEILRSDRESLPPADRKLPGGAASALRPVFLLQPHQRAPSQTRFPPEMLDALSPEHRRFFDDVYHPQFDRR